MSPVKLKQLVEVVKDFAYGYLEQNLSPQLTFHNKKHTVEVVEATVEICCNTNISESEAACAIIAACFHDCGYSTTYLGHEEQSKIVAIDFLSRRGCNEDFIIDVLKCIDATRVPQSPASLTEAILCDADLYHFVKPTYQQYANALRQELEVFLFRSYSDSEWHDINEQFLTAHRYFTDYGKVVLTDFKEVNLRRWNQSAKSIQ